MRPHGLSTFLVSFTLFVSSATTSQAQDSPAEVLKAWMEAYASMDGQRASAVYTEDARLWGKGVGSRVSDVRGLPSILDGLDPEWQASASLLGTIAYVH
jgi:hypothetical protein